MKEALRAKIHGAHVTDTRKNYEGSLTVGKNLLEASDIDVYDKAQIVNINNGKRFETYIVEGKSGQIHLNGAAARLGEIGDEIIIISYGIYEDGSENPTVVHVDEENKVESVEVK